jgi:hypothetical protein
VESDFFNFNTLEEVSCVPSISRLLLSWSSIRSHQSPVLDPPFT